MGVEGGPANVGALQDLFDDDGVKGLFPNQRAERLVQELFGPLNPPVLSLFCRHGYFTRQLWRRSGTTSGNVAGIAHMTDCYPSYTVSRGYTWIMIDVDDKQLKNSHSTAGTTGRVLHSAALYVLHSAALYDVVAWLRSEEHTSELPS